MNWQIDKFENIDEEKILIASRFFALVAAKKCSKLETYLDFDSDSDSLQLNLQE